MKTASLLAALLILSGCATCRQHPVACSIGGAFIVGSIAASVDHGGGGGNQRATAARRGMCAPQGGASCGP